MENNETLSSLVISTLNEIDVKMELGEIDRLLRLGKKDENNKKIRPILLTTTSTTQQRKAQIMKNKRKLKSTAYITHDLPKEILQKRKESRIQNSNKTENEKRKRADTPSPKSQNAATSKVPKTTKNNNFQKEANQIDAFQYMRERSYSFSDKNTYRN
ncbi:uncharacterized protein LOC121736748 [Aricia agestis]|uniref:uncharacterized protein LOC121736748 n=1 Tax=Aricia agestis TaxID=91739 RepID=UPI001C202A4C|nr:uncharacterized protein LOC121736748 [Aricia agestis]